MAKKLKTYETSLGFFDLAIAAPSMKAALEAWGADSNLFHQGAAKQSEDPDVVAATMAKRRIAPVTAIRGNVDIDDWAVAYPETEVVRLAGKSIYVLHDLKTL